MGKSVRKPSRPVTAFLCGLIGLSLVLAGHGLGLDERAELQTLDWRLRHVSPAETPANLLHVDIDDRSLNELGRWPWHREQLAGLLDVLRRAGAQMILLDIILPEPQKVRLVQPFDDVYDPDASDLRQEVPPRRVYDDMILERALRRAEGAFLPFHVSFRRGSLSPARRALRRAAAVELARRPAESYRQFHDALRESGFAADSEELLPEAYLHQQGLGALRRFALPEEAVQQLPLRRGTIIPPLAPLARAVDGSGFVTFQPDGDGAVRRIALVCRAEGGVYPQFALAAAREILARRHGGSCDVRVEERRLLLQTSDGARREIPLDEDGRMLIRWAKPRPAGSAPTHLSAAGVGGIWRDQQNFQDNRRRVRLIQVGLAQELHQADLLDLFRQADALALRREAVAKRRYAAMLYDPAHIPPFPKDLIRAEKDLERQIDRAMAELLREMDEFYLAHRPEEAAAAARYDKLQASRALLREIEAANRALARQIRRDRNRLKRFVEGKICLVGSTSTGAADFVPTPLGPRTPGVVVHGNILNTILTGRFLRPAPAWLNGATIVLCGVLVSLLAAGRSALQAGILTAILAVGVVVFTIGVVFAMGNVWLALVGPVAAMAGSFLFVTVYRQLTEERARRRIRSLFAHALSETLVARIEEDPSVLQLGGQQRSVTCLFSDLAGFTSLSERLGPAETVRLLNRYFDRVAETVQNRRGGYLNKFLGDGVFALFGAPVFQDDHAARALHAAVDCRNDVRCLNEELLRERGGSVSLSVRIGVTTGEAMVGNCGSTQRMDYTAIGDCVNLAARLEAANKYFGTEILVTEEAWRRGGTDGWLARPLGRVLVTGQREPAVLWNLLDRDGEAPEKLRQAVALFQEGLEAFGRRDFRGAEEAFLRARELLPDDGPSGVYLELCRACQADPSLQGSTGYPTRSGKGVDTLLWPWA